MTPENREMVERGQRVTISNTAAVVKPVAAKSESPTNSASGAAAMQNKINATRIQ